MHTLQLLLLAISILLSQAVEDGDDQYGWHTSQEYRDEHSDATPLDAVWSQSVVMIPEDNAMKFNCILVQQNPSRIVRLRSSWWSWSNHDHLLTCPMNAFRAVRVDEHEGKCVPRTRQQRPQDDQDIDQLERRTRMLHIQRRVGEAGTSNVQPDVLDITGDITPFTEGHSPRDHVASMLCSDILFRSN